ncbi:low specificity L-threonine aldolase [Aquamicrobium sp. LC103]|uniref:threonine aldolase family protein n=1 Tax=Aquamicrobium sp. LC103 TaxID=1120658 RepID=UPI00063EBA67|nr:low specificity L-threonine aldolase [Aquamicrobium sp. LC103]TKT77546.1 low specificity L-threonine aldolase [Aquamicrobium sp. LC103]
MHFASDNWAGAHPAIAESLSLHAKGFAAAYGASDLDKQVERKFSEIFERDVAVFFVSTGTAANSLAMTAVNRVGGVSFCHREAHMTADECGAPEYFMGGSRLHAVDGVLGRIDPGNLEAAIAHFPPEFVHAGRPAAVSITQATEIGTIYSLEQIRAISDICRKHGLPLHMDGARFANALVSLDVSPAEMTWRQGVDIVSFGGTKNGCWCAEAVVFLDPAMAADFAFVRKRGAQLFSKSRFVAAQFDAYFRDDLWLRMARHSNAMTERLAGHIESATGARLGWEPQANELFPIVGRSKVEELKSAGAVFYPWHPPHGFAGGIDEAETMCRLVTSFATTQDEVDRFGELLG